VFDGPGDYSHQMQINTHLNLFLEHKKLMPIN
jgi:hypothetical protein